MKVLSFSCSPNDKTYLEQVLPALLNKTKAQTIRPALMEWAGIKESEIK